MGLGISTVQRHGLVWGWSKPQSCLFSLLEALKGGIVFVVTRVCVCVCVCVCALLTP